MMVMLQPRSGGKSLGTKLGHARVIMQVASNINRDLISFILSRLSPIHGPNESG
jgi:hypothetical protein